ncbi:lytic transglycosylase [Gluconacetobacter sacchari DSM 12717]|uniref:Lytic transglycosylase domain-containing protein n=2 Tax=Gluconacetobacter sacchari TaxID=92759 RepID=A0A7W4IAB3_9PROT|nr:lytic transglycosylase domain-containing protein [Gluconacetobacter sacchari]MBB2159139.1 lytic transglycosylase domain-containing protein [Gluconacetobacter sacchari]GBQ31858.1 lytic transglycosylase [Gluconacetobacter sacchari DSM 12717]
MTAPRGRRIAGLAALAVLACLFRPAAARDPAPAAVAARVEAYLHLLSPEGGGIDDYLTFLDQQPAWPRRAAMLARVQGLMALVPPDDGGLARACAKLTLTASPALLACAGSASPPGGLAARARQAWIAGIDRATDEAPFLAVFGGALTEDDQWRRFNRQELDGHVDAARRQAGRLPPARKTLAFARLALRTARPDSGPGPGLSALATVPPALAGDPVLVLDRLRWLRRTGQIDQAAALWPQAGMAAERRLPLPAFWSERDALAHEMLLAGRDQGALALAATTADMTPAARNDADFLAGWILLRRLHDPKRAAGRFRPLCSSPSLITLSRGLYWTGRALEEEGDISGAHAEWQRAAALPGTFYGQMALSRLDGDVASPLLFPERSGALIRARLGAMAPPAWNDAETARFEASDLVQAARLLAARGDLTHARDFVLMQDSRGGSAAGHALAAVLALRLGIPDVAVTITRRAGRDGIALLPLGWPTPFPTGEDGLPPGFVMAVIRQESSFDPAIVSPAGAYGLMQLLPAAARDVSRWAGLATGTLTGASLTDPALNMRIGTAYLSRLMRKFDGTIPYVLAAYNAGPHRTDQWLASVGDPAHADPTPTAMLDWIESIPFAETRSYIQRVEENLAIYQALASESRPEAPP